MRPQGRGTSRRRRAPWSEDRDDLFGPSLVEQTLQRLGQVGREVRLPEAHRWLRQEEVRHLSATGCRQQCEHRSRGVTEKCRTAADGIHDRCHILRFALRRVRSGISTATAGTTVDSHPVKTESGESLCKRRAVARG